MPGMAWESVAGRPSPPGGARAASIARNWGLLGLFLALAGLLALGYRASAIAVTLVIDGRHRRLETHAGTVGDLLLEHAVAVSAGDWVDPPAGARLRDGDRVLVQRARPVRLRADGRDLALRSHGRSALAVLQEAGLRLGPGDAVKVNGRPWPVDQRIEAPQAGAPDSARMQGEDLVPRSSPPRRSAQSSERRLPPMFHVAAAAALTETGAIALPGEPGSDDALAGAAASAPGAGQDEAAAGAAGADLPLPGADAAWTIEVYRARLVTLQEDGGIPIQIEMAGATVAEGLASAGLALLPGDEVHPPAGQALAGTTRITVLRAMPFSVEADGQTRELRAHAATVGEALADVGMAPHGADYSIPAASDPLTPGLLVRLVRVREEIQTVEAEIPFATETRPDPALPLDQQSQVQAGAPGLKRQQVRLRYENGEEVAREVLEEQVLQATVPQILAYGTQVVWNTVDTEQGPKQYWRKLRMYATSYSPARAGTPKSAPWYGRTRSGFVLRQGIVATDPRIIPLGMWVYVPGYGVAIAGDTGGGVKNYKIDLGYRDDDYQSWHQYVDVYVLDRLPPEHQMLWILP